MTDKIWTLIIMIDNRDKQKGGLGNVERERGQWEGDWARETW